MSKKKHHHEEHEEHVNHEAWVIPYADMLTLLMALFLVMWASGQTDLDKARQVAAGFADSLGIEGNGSGVGGVGIFDGAERIEESSAQPDIKPKVGAEAIAALGVQKAMEQSAAASAQQIASVEKALAENAARAGTGAELAFRTEPRGLVVSIVSEGVLFDPGSADLRPEGRRVLDGIAPTLHFIPNRIAVEGHTDDRPIATGRFPSNWELSTARAAAVLRYLVDWHRLNPGRVSASGYGDTQPAASNADDAGRARNRRVDIAILSEIGSAAAPSAPTTTIFEPIADAGAPAAPASEHAHPEGSP